MTTTAPSFTLGDRLAKARRVADVSQSEMADELGLSRKTINNYEADRTPVRIGVLRVWAIKCGVPLEWLETGAAPNSSWIARTAIGSRSSQPDHAEPLAA